MKRIISLAVLLAVTLGTSCMTIRQSRQMLHPSPPLACIKAALIASPDVIEVTREWRESRSEGYWAVLRDSTAAGGQRVAGIGRDPKDRASTLKLTFSWPGLGGPPAAEEHAAEALAVRLLSHLRMSCAPGEPAEPYCDRGNGKFKPCAPA